MILMIMFLRHCVSFINMFIDKSYVIDVIIGNIQGEEIVIVSISLQRKEELIRYIDRTHTQYWTFRKSYTHKSGIENYK